MRWIAGILLSLWISTVFAQNELRVGITVFNPPFIMKAANGIHFGFDITLIDEICKIMNKPCRFVTYRFDKLFQALKDDKIDMAVSGLTITLERSQKYANFSIPYMNSYGHFLANEKFAKSFQSLSQLNGKTIGVIRGSVYAKATELMPLSDIKLAEYKRSSDLITDIEDGDIEVALIDAPTAHYWNIHSYGRLRIIGGLFDVGNGLGIAVNKQKPALLDDINTALKNYIKTENFKKLYKKYFFFKPQHTGH